MNRIKFLKEKLTSESMQFFKYLTVTNKSDNVRICEEMAKQFPELQLCLQDDEIKETEEFALNMAVTQKALEIKEKYNWIGKTILVIDGDLMSRKLITEILNDKYCNILFANDETEVFGLLMKSNKIDLVLIEVWLTKVNGFELIKKIKLFDEGIPVIAQTVCALKHEQDNCFICGCDDFISKPIELDKFVEVIDLWTT